MKNKKKREAAKQQKEAPAERPTAAQTAVPLTADASPMEKEKRIKGIEKKLKSIAGIKEAVAKGQTVEDGQRQKMLTEPALLAELASLKI